MYEAVLGSIIKMRCIVDAVPPAFILWSQVKDWSWPDDVVVAAHFPGVPSYGILQINVSQFHEGAWYCTANNQFSGRRERFTVDILGKFLCHVYMCVCKGVNLIVLQL